MVTVKFQIIKRKLTPEGAVYEGVLKDIEWHEKEYNENVTLEQLHNAINSYLESNTDTIGNVSICFK